MGLYCMEDDDADDDNCYRILMHSCFDTSYEAILCT